MARTKEEFVELLKEVARIGGDTEELMTVLKDVQSEFDERESASKYTDTDVFGSDGVRWSQKYDDAQRRYRDRFFSSPEEVKQDNAEDIEKDDESTTTSYEELFVEREGNYK